MTLKIDIDADETFIVRDDGKKLGEIAALDLKDRIRFQVISPWAAKSYETLEDAVESLRLDNEAGPAVE